MIRRTSNPKGPSCAATAQTARRSLWRPILLTVVDHAVTRVSSQATSLNGCANIYLPARCAGFFLKPKNRPAMFEADEIAEGERTTTLGPAYFAARKSAERFMAAFEAEHFKPMIDRFSRDFRDAMWGDVVAFFLSDTESNLQGEMWRHADSMVRHVLAGEEWAMKKFALGERYDCEKVRAAVAKSVPRELQDARIADLEAEVAKLKNDLAFYRNR